MMTDLPVHMISSKSLQYGRTDGSGLVPEQRVSAWSGFSGFMQGDKSTISFFIYFHATLRLFIFNPA